jgi:hypothetical protein
MSSSSRKTRLFTRRCAAADTPIGGREWPISRSGRRRAKTSVWPAGTFCASLQLPSKTTQTLLGALGIEIRLHSRRPRRNRGHQDTCQIREHRQQRPARGRCATPTGSNHYCRDLEGGSPIGQASVMAADDADGADAKMRPFVSGNCGWERLDRGSQPVAISIYWRARHRPGLICG